MQTVRSLLTSTRTTINLARLRRRGTGALHALLLVTGLIFLWGGSAHAFSAGITGLSGKNQGLNCNSCHQGGTAPVVALDGPTTVAPNSTSTYTFTVTSQSSAQVAAGIDVAVSAGTLMVDSAQNARVQSGEVVHNSPKMNVAGAASWEFTFTAPGALGSVTMFASGNSVDLKNASVGDKATSTTLTIDVAEAVDTPTPSPTPTTASTPTRAPTLPPVPCVGDCNGNGRVTVDELIVGVNIALDRAQITACPSFDRDGSQSVSVSELVSGVNALLRNCVPTL